MYVYNIKWYLQYNVCLPIEHKSLHRAKFTEPRK